MNEQSEPTTAKDTNVPTTGEIVRALLSRSVDKKSINRRKIEIVAADRLKSQEEEIKWMNKKFDDLYKTWRESDGAFLKTIAALTARAEQAEAREKAIIESLRDRCEFCIGYELEESDDPCSTCYNARTFEPDDIPRTKNWTWRGLPQDGEGKQNG